MADMDNEAEGLNLLHFPRSIVADTEQTMTRAITSDDDKMRAALAAVLRQQTVTEEYTRVLAHFRKVAYDALIDEGFTSDQALRLCIYSTPFDLPSARC